MQSLQQVTHNLRLLKPYLTDMYNVDSLSIFGSFARKEQTETSDLDILVDFTKTPDLLTFIALEEYLSKELVLNVDLVPKRKVKAQLQQQIFQEAIAV